MVGQAANRAEAIEPVRSSDPGIVLADIKMPDTVMSGQAAAGQAQSANLSTIEPRPTP
jgi:YesN/AraC family two-component response regulator